MSQAVDLNQGLSTPPRRKFRMLDSAESADEKGDDLSISSLDECDLLQAYALVQLHDADLSLHGWCERVTRDWKEGRSHWAVVRDARGYIHAVFRYVVNTTAVLSQQSDVTDLYAAGLAKRYALSAISLWSPNSTSGEADYQAMPSDWILAVANTSEL